VLAPVLSARGVARAGLDAHDVAEAAASLHLERDPNVERALSRAERVRRSWPTRVTVLVFSLPNLWMVLDALLSAGNLTAAEIAFFLVTNGGLGVACLATAIDPGLVIGALEGGSPRFAGLLRWLWGGPVGRMLFAVSRLGLKRPRVLLAERAERTEILLGRAVGDLFEQLRKDQRTRLGDVPEVIARLESAAASLRARRDALGTALADVGSPSASPRRAELAAELGHAREAVEERLATAVAALENLRLDLLRLRAGVARADDLTAAIQEARAIGEAVDAELAGSDAVEDLLNN